MGIRAAALLGIPLLLAACGVSDPLPPRDVILRLQLHDSLSRYETVDITLIDIRDTGLVLEKVWSGPLPKPSQVPGHTLTKAKDRDFIVRILGYGGGNQLMLETWIRREAGIKTVLHKDVPPYKPRFQLRALGTSAGTLAPPFTPEETSYTLVLPEGAAQVAFTANPVLAGAGMTLDGDSIRPGTATAPMAVGRAPDTARFLITDASQGRAYAREYVVVVIPTLPPAVRLASLTPSVGTLAPAFHPDTGTYALALPAGAEEVTFTMRPASASTMTLVFNGFSIFSGQVSPPVTVPAGGKDMAYVEVRRGPDMKLYQILISRAAAP